LAGSPNVTLVQLGTCECGTRSLPEDIEQQKTIRGGRRRGAQHEAAMDDVSMGQRKRAAPLAPVERDFAFPARPHEQFGRLGTLVLRRRAQLRGVVIDPVAGLDAALAQRFGTVRRRREDLGGIKGGKADPSQRGETARGARHTEIVVDCRVRVHDRYGRLAPPSSHAE
jgi:hypothetical protein